jgi:chromosome segregation ATPase
MKDALSLIKELTDEIEDLEIKLEVQADNLGNAREGWNDAECKVQKLTEENERLSGKVEMYEEERKYHFEMSRKRISETRADTVREMQERLTKEFDRMHKSNFITVEVRQWIIDQIAKEMLEANDGRKDLE